MFSLFARPSWLDASSTTQGTETKEENDVEEQKLGLLQTLETDEHILRRSESRYSQYVVIGKQMATHSLSVILMILILGVWTQPWDPSQATYSPANHVIEYETKVFTAGVGKPVTAYEGYPDDNVDAAWDDLYKYGVRLHISEAEARQLPNATTEIPGMEGQYVVGLGAFHQLHCVNMLRKYIYPERYGIRAVLDNGTRDEGMTEHLSHCIEHLRQAAMCHSDTSTLYYVWDPQDQQSRLSMEITHTCRNFEKIRKWAFSHYFKDFDRYTKTKHS